MPVQGVIAAGTAGTVAGGNCSTRRHVLHRRFIIAGGMLPGLWGKIQISGPAYFRRRALPVPYQWVSALRRKGIRQFCGPDNRPRNDSGSPCQTPNRFGRKMLAFVGRRIKLLAFANLSFQAGWCVARRMKGSPGGGS